MARRILIHLAALLAGGTLGLALAGLMYREMSVDPIVFAMIVAAFIFLSQVLANLLVERTSTGRETIIREPVIRGIEPWGWLKPASGIGAGFPLNKECIRVGRGVEMDITLNNASISRRHAQLRRLPDGCLLEDLGSRNGVFVNGTRIKEQTLTDGDNVAVGEVKFVFLRVGSFRSPGAGLDAVGREEAGRAFRSTSELRAPGRSDDAEAPTLVGRDVRPFDETSEYDHDDDLD